MKAALVIVGSFVGLLVLLVVLGMLVDPCRDPASAECRRQVAAQADEERRAAEVEQLEREAEEEEKRRAAAARAAEEREARRRTACVVNTFGAKLCGEEAAAYCNLMFDQLDAEDVASHQACSDLIPERYAEWEADYQSRRIAESELYGD